MLSLFLEGLSQTEIAKRLRVTQPAIVLRTRKYFDIFEVNLFQAKEKKLNLEGKEKVKVLKKALITLMYGEDRPECNIKDVI